MSLGLEQALAEYLNSLGFGGLYDDPDIANRVIFIDQFPETPLHEPGRSDISTTNDLTITVFGDGGGPPQLLLGETHTITIQCRHPKYETAAERQRAIYSVLQENGGQSNGANPLAQGVFRGIRIWRITADFPAVKLGRDAGQGDGRFRTTQSFTVRTLPYTYT